MNELFLNKRDSGTADMDETVSFNVQVVPEFPAMVAIVMAVSIMMIVIIAKLSDKTVPNTS